MPHPPMMLKPTGRKYGLPSFSWPRSGPRISRFEMARGVVGYSCSYRLCSPRRGALPGSICQRVSLFGRRFFLQGGGATARWRSAPGTRRGPAGAGRGGNARPTGSR